MNAEMDISKNQWRSTGDIVTYYNLHPFKVADLFSCCYIHYEVHKYVLHNLMIHVS